MLITHLYTAKDGRSSVQKVTVPRSAKAGSDNEDSMRFNVETAFLRELGGTYDSEYRDYDWHEPSHRQLIVQLSGAMDITAEDGTTAHIGPGDVLLAEDFNSMGHLTRSWRGVRLYMLLAADADLGRLLGEVVPDLEGKRS